MHDQIRSVRRERKGKHKRSLIDQIALAFHLGARSGLVYLTDFGDKVVFERWRRFLATAIEDVTLVLLDRREDESRRYTVSVGGEAIGIIRIRQRHGRWCVIGVEEFAEALEDYCENAHRRRGSPSTSSPAWRTP